MEGIGSSFNEAGEIEEDQEKAKGLRISKSGRNRAPLLPFGALTSRNTPPGRAYLFTCSKWMRFLVRPGKGRAVAAIDWRAQEIRIAANLSGDSALLEMCAHEDPYMQFAIILGLAPPGATEKSHRAARKICKVLGLALLYGGGARMVVAKTNMGLARAAALLRQLREKFAVFDAWSDNFAYRGLSAAPLWSRLGWRFWPQYWKDGRTPDRTCRNFPVQSAGADIMRIAAIEALKAGIRICAIVHDEFVIEDSIDNIEQSSKAMSEIMMRSTEEITGRSIPVDCQITRYPQRCYDDDGKDDFEMIMQMLEEIEQRREVA
jgi:DNA polymerase I